MQASGLIISEALKFSPRLRYSLRGKEITLMSANGTMLAKLTPDTDGSVNSLLPFDVGGVMNWPTAQLAMQFLQLVHESDSIRKLNVVLGSTPTMELPELLDKCSQTFVQAECSIKHNTVWLKAKDDALLAIIHFRGNVLVTLIPKCPRSYELGWATVELTLQFISLFYKARAVNAKNMADKEIEISNILTIGGKKDDDSN